MWRWVTRGVVVLGLVLMLTSSWRLWWLQTRLSEGNACTLHGLCDAVANAHAQERLGWYFLLGIAVVLTGLVMTFVRRRYEDAVAPVAGPSGLPEWAHHERETMPPWEHAAFSLAVLLPLVFATPVALLFVFLGPHSFLAMLAVYWIVAAFLLDRLHRAVSTDSRQRALLTSLLAPGLSIVPLVGSLPLGLASISTGAVAVLGSALIQGGVVLVGRTWPWPWRRPEVWLAAGVALVVGGLGIQQTLLHQGDGSLTRVAVALSEAVDPRVAVSGPTPHDAPTPTPSPNPTTPTPSTPTATAPTPTAPTSPVKASRPCRAGDLTFETTGWDAASGTTATQVVARNTGRSACWVEGVPAFRLTQGRTDLRIRVLASDRSPGGTTVVTQRVGLARGDRASVRLWWPGYRAIANQRTPQSLDLALDEADDAAEPTWAPVTIDPADAGPAPFDVIARARLKATPWQYVPPRIAE